MYNKNAEVVETSAFYVAERGGFEKRTVPGALAITGRRNTPLNLFSNLFSKLMIVYLSADSVD